MRGKSIDTEFVAEFIQECTQKNRISPDEICEEALERIEEIDKQLKMRLKLADVLSFFNFKKKASPVELEPVDFFEMDRAAASEILGIISNNGCMSTADLTDRFATYVDSYRKVLLFTMKQMLETKVLFRNSNGLLAHGVNHKLFNEQKI